MSEKSPSKKPPPLTISRSKFLKLGLAGGAGVIGVIVVGKLLNLESPTTQTPNTTFSFKVVSVDSSGNIFNQETKSAIYYIANAKKKVTMDFVKIPEGTFTMGSPATEKNSKDDEKPQHQVTVSDFWMSKYPVTQGEYELIMGNNPSKFKGADRPVEKVSWDDAVKFCHQLSKKIGKKLRLPSEAEWEYACRAMTTTPFHFGPTLTTELANYDGNYTYASEPEGVYLKETTPVGKFHPNAFGLYDMHGNVWEWVADDWHENYQGAPNDGSAWLSQSNIKVARGGSCHNSPGGCRSANRYGEAHDSIYHDLGFRVVCTIV